jgi:hypothetical protein
LQLAGVDPIVINSLRDQAQINLYWRLDRAAQRNFDFTLRLIDRSGAEWGLWQGTAFDNWSAKKWPVGQYIQQAVSITLPHGLPAGDYALVVSVRDRQTGEVLSALDGSEEMEAVRVKMD